MAAHIGEVHRRALEAQGQSGAARTSKQGKTPELPKASAPLG